MSLTDFVHFLAEEPLKTSIVLGILALLIWASEFEGLIKYARQFFMRMYLLFATVYPAIYVIYPPGDFQVERVFALYSPHIALLALMLASMHFFELMFDRSRARHRKTMPGPL